MNVAEYILDGLEEALELERELGVRSVEIDCGVLGAGVDAASSPRPNKEPAVSFQRGGDAASTVVKRPVPPPVTQNLRTSKPQNLLPLVFLHDRPLSPKGVEMMAKILAALGKPDAPIVVVPPVPAAKVTVVLGGLALKKYFTGMRGEPGQWQKAPEGRDVLITYSPEYILRFGTVTPAVQKIKQDMWLSLKAVKQRLEVEG